MAIDPEFRADWRPKRRWVRRFFATYLKWVVRGGYAFVFLSFTALIVSFTIQIDQTVSTQGGELGFVEVASQTVKADGKFLIAALLVPENSRVEKGQPVMEVWEFPSAGPPKVAFPGADAPAEPRLTKRTVSSPADGTFLLTKAAREGLVPRGSDLFRVADFSRVQVRATVRGETVADAAVGSTAKLTQFDVAPDAKSIIRMELDGAPRSTKRALGETHFEHLEKALKGANVSLNNDRTLRISELERVEADVDLEFSGSPRSTHGALPVDPAPEVELTGVVASGTHRAKVQFSNLNEAERNALWAALRNAMMYQMVPEGDALRWAPIGQVTPTNAVVQVSLEGPADPRRALPKVQGREAALLERTFEVLIPLENPPEWLQMEVRRAALSGETIRCRVEIVTGKMPLALRLLKR